MCSEIGLSSTEKFWQSTTVRPAHSFITPFEAKQEQKINSRENLEEMKNYLYHKAQSLNPFHMFWFWNMQVHLKDYHLQDSPNNSICLITSFP